MRAPSVARSVVVAALFAVSSVVSSCNALFPFNADQVCESEVHALCHFAYACCNTVERDGFNDQLGVAGFRNEGECVDFLLRDGSAECGNAFAVYDASNEKRFTYDAALAQKCLQPGIDALNTCDAQKVLADDAAPEKDCEGLGVGVGNFAFGKGELKKGDKCFADFECSDAGSKCVITPDNADDGKLVLTDVGACVSPGKEGDDCSADTGTNGLCDAGLACGVDSQTCDAVNLKQNGEGCADDAECDSDFCDDVAGVVGASCADKLDDGADCLDDNDCINNLCQDPAGGNALVCQPKVVIQIDACNGIQADDTDFGK